jgi:hypothetical protein
VPIATTPEQRALQASLRDWAKRADTIAVTRARADPAALMTELTALGVFAIPADGTVTDLAAALDFSRELATVRLDGAALENLVPVLTIAERLLGLPR